MGTSTEKNKKTYSIQADLGQYGIVPDWLMAGPDEDDSNLPVSFRRLESFNLGDESVWLNRGNTELEIMDGDSDPDPLNYEEPDWLTEIKECHYPPTQNEEDLREDIWGKHSQKK